MSDNPLWDESAVGLGENDGELVHPGESGFQLKYYSPDKHHTPYDGSMRDSRPSPGKLRTKLEYGKNEWRREGRVPERP